MSDLADVIGGLLSAHNEYIKKYNENCFEAISKIVSNSIEQLTFELTNGKIIPANEYYFQFSDSVKASGAVAKYVRSDVFDIWQRVCIDVGIKSNKKLKAIVRFDDNSWCECTTNSYINITLKVKND